MRMVRVLIVFGAMLAVAPAAAQPSARSAATSNERQAWSAALDALAAKLERGYVFAEKGKEAAAALRANRASLMKSTDAKAFAKAASNIANAKLGDVHLYFAHDPAENARLSAPSKDDDSMPATPPVDARGFSKVERLTGNIGLLQLDSLKEPNSIAGARAVAAMEMLRGSDDVIIDLRRNAGGSGRMNQLISSYFVDEGEDTWLVSNENRSAGTFVQEWTQPYVPGARMPKVPLYFLVGPSTGSAAEGLAYNLQARKRALVIGEKSAGGAHSGEFTALPGGFVTFIPTGRTINPVSKSNWERTGVPLDVSVPWSRAQSEVLRIIWSKRAGAAAKGSPEAEAAQWHADYYAAKVKAPPLPAWIDAAVGTYESDVSVTRSGDYLYYATSKGPVRALLPLGNDEFVMDWNDYYGPGTSRIRFVRDAQGRVTGLQELVRHEPLKVAAFDSRKVG